jgi:hypothetical protein
VKQRDYFLTEINLRKFVMGSINLFHHHTMRTQGSNLNVLLVTPAQSVAIVTWLITKSSAQERPSPHTKYNNLSISIMPFNFKNSAHI